MPTQSELAELLRGLRSSPKRVPVSFLYDARGSELYQRITELEEYYPYREERGLLRRHAAAMARSCVPREALVVELGCGDATKTCMLLQAIARLHGSFEFAGIDVSQEFLDQARTNIEAAVAAVQTEEGHANASGQVHTVCADYMEGLRQVRDQFPDRFLVILWLGSSIGNLADQDARSFLQGLLRAAGPNISLLLATDLWKSTRVLQLAYDDPHGVTSAFIRNGLRHALRTLGCHVSDEDVAKAWGYKAFVNTDNRRVEMWVRCKKHVEVLQGDITLSPGEEVFMEMSRKFSPDDLASLAQSSGFIILNSWSTDFYRMQLLVPPTQAMQACWNDTDAFFASLRNWDASPIEFRRPFSFYYGHLAAFAALKLLPGRDELGNRLDVLYSRGIDPQLLDPSKCHKHPAPPKEWPTRRQVQEYVESVRDSIQQYLHTSTEAVLPKAQLSAVQAFMRCLFVALEHEWMHQETLAYMKAQEDMKNFLADSQQSQTKEQRAKAGNGLEFQSSNGTGALENDAASGLVPAPLKPSRLPQPTPSGPGLTSTFGGVVDLAHTWKPELDVLIPPGPVSLGVDVSFGAPACTEAGQGAKDPAKANPVRFAWDNEGPQQPPCVLTHSLLVSSQPVTVAQFHCFVTCMRGYSRPELWLVEDWLFLKKHNMTCPALWAAPTSSTKGCMDGLGTERKDYWVYVAEGREGRELGCKDPSRACMRPWQEVQDEPVFVSLAEAEAFCKAVGGTSGVRVMKEEEWNRIVEFKPDEEGHASQGGHSHSEDSPSLQHTYTNGMGQNGALLCPHQKLFQTQSNGSPTNGSENEVSGSSVELRALQASVRRGGWEWTSSLFEPFPGFHAMPEYPEYSTDFFDGLHYVLKGSSPVTPPAIVRDSFRNYYQRQYPYVFAKFRCCKPVNAAMQGTKGF